MLALRSVKPRAVDCGANARLRSASTSPDQKFWSKKRASTSGSLAKGGCRRSRNAWLARRPRPLRSAGMTPSGGHSLPVERVAW